MLVCSSCHTPLVEGTAHCPRCGPGSLVLLSREGLPASPRATEGEGVQRLGRALGPQYRVVRLIGRGGFAEVYEVLDTDLQRRLAVKVLRADLPWTSGTLSRFKQEARAIARLNHPNTVPIHFVAEGEGLVFYAMPFLEGRTLADILRIEGPLPVDRVLAIAEPILDALQHAHEHGLVHRDVKPDNILIEAGTGRALLVDFGIVKWLDGPSHHTDAGFIVGTPLYMSPEQALGWSNVDARADIYGIGAVLFQLLTGAPPFQGNDSQEIVSRHLSEPVPMKTLSKDGIPVWLSRVVQRCMAKHPDDRFPTARALLEALRAGRSGGRPRPTEEETPTEALPAARRPRRWGWWAGAAALLGVVLLPPLFALRPRASLVVQNRLAEPIAIAMDDTEFIVAPGDSSRIPVPPGRSLEAHWALVQPAAGDGRSLGDVMEGTIVAQRARGEVRRVVHAGSDGRARFAPIVVNATPRPVAVTVISPADSADCRCTVPPGSSLRLGYYSHSEASAVRITDSRGRVARFAGAALQRDSVSGEVLIRVEPSALRSPARPPAKPAPAAKAPRPVKLPAEERRDPLRGILPVR
ncbi:MAG: serine/threonine-protein kinase [Gemmatimonadales bacterium]